MSGSLDGRSCAVRPSASTSASACLRDVLALRPVRLRDRDEHLPERRHPVPRLRRVVRAAEERLAVGGEEHGHRPAAVTAERDDRIHVDGVDVRALLPVDLDAHVELVHDRRRLGVLERLALHHVAPVARAVADRQQNRLVLGAGSGEGLVAPRVPVDRVRGVLEEVRARFLGEAVHDSAIILACATKNSRSVPSTAAASGGPCSRPTTSGSRS